MVADDLEDWHEIFRKLKNHFLKTIMNDLQWLTGRRSEEELVELLRWAEGQYLSDLESASSGEALGYRIDEVGKQVRLASVRRCLRAEVKKRLKELLREEEGVKYRSRQLAPKLVGSRLRLVVCEAEDCHWMFHDRREMLRHFRTAHEGSMAEPGDERIHECPQDGCVMRYVRLCNLKRHIAKAHPQLLE